MKKIAVLGLLFFITFSQLFANENSDKFENISFGWQLFYYQKNNQEIDYIYINPMFFNDNKNYMLNYFVFINQINNFQNNSSQNNRNVQVNAQENNWGLFLLRIFAESMGFYYWYNHKQY
jgi:hypothetical protein